MYKCWRAGKLHALVSGGTPIDHPDCPETLSGSSTVRNKVACLERETCESEMAEIICNC